MKRILRHGWWCMALAAVAVGCKSTTPSTSITPPPTASAPVTGVPPIAGAQVAYTPPAQNGANPALPQYSVVTANSYPYSVASTQSTTTPSPGLPAPAYASPGYTPPATTPSPTATPAPEAAKPWWKGGWFSKSTKSDEQPPLRTYEERKRSYEESVSRTD